MIQTMQSELFRIRKKTACFWVCLVLAAFFCLCACPDLLSQFGKWYASGYITGFVHGVSVFRLQSDFFPLTLFLCLYFTEDFHTGTYSITLSKGTSRVHLFFGKLLASWGGVFIFFCLYAFGVAYLSILMMGASRYDIEYSFFCNRSLSFCFNACAF